MRSLREKILISASFVFAAFIGLAQSVVPRDSSYTLDKAYAHQLKHNQDSTLHITAVRSNPSSAIITRTDVVYKQMGDRKLKANLFYPSKKKQNKAAILMIHGGGWRSGFKEMMTPMAERFSAEGYLVMAPEYRLSLEAKYPAGIEDVHDALNYLVDHAKSLGADSDKLVVLGCSAGGQLAALLATTYNNPQNVYGLKPKGKVVALVDVDGVLAFRHPESAEGTVAAQWLGGTCDEVPDTWEQASALNHVDRYTPPTLFLSSIHPRFLAGRKDYIDKLKPFGTYSETQYLDRAPHTFWLFNPWYELTVNHILGFLKKTL